MRILTIAVLVGLLGTEPLGAESASNFRIWIDCSGSMSVPELHEMLPDLEATISKNAPRLDSIEVVCFGDAETTAKAHTLPVSLGHPPVQVPYQPPSGDQLTLEEKIYKVAYQARVDREKRENMKAAQEELRRYQENVARQIIFLGATLERDASMSTPHTSYSALAHRLTEENRRLNLIISDGERYSPEPLEKAQTTTTILIVLLHKNKEADDFSDLHRFESRKADMIRFFPNSKVIRPYLFADSLNALLSQP